MQDWLIYVGNNHEYLVYLIIIVLACAEGPILSMIFGVLIKLGYFSFVPVYVALMIGDLLGDTVWYYVGRKWGHGFISRFGKYVSVTEEKVGIIDRIFHGNKYKILFISKISNGFGFALVTLMTAGIVKIPFAKYLTVNLIGQFIWSGILIGVGYFFSNLYMQVDSVLSKIGIVAFFIILIAAFLGYKNYLKNRIEKLEI